MITKERDITPAGEKIWDCFTCGKKVWVLLYKVGNCIFGQCPCCKKLAYYEYHEVKR